MDRETGFKIVKCHSCGDPCQGLAYQHGASRTFKTVLSNGQMVDIDESGYNVQLWGGRSLRAVKADIEKNHYENPQMALEDNAGFKYFTNKGKRFTPLGRNVVPIDQDRMTGRFVSNSGEVVYVRHEPDFSDIVPKDFGVILPPGSHPSQYIVTPTQFFNLDGYSRTCNATTLGISKSIGIKQHDWCSQGQVRTHQKQRVVEMNDNFNFVHFELKMRNIASVRILRDKNNPKMNTHITSAGLETNGDDCDYCLDLLESL